MIHHHMIFDGDGLSGVIVGTAQVIAKQSVRQIVCGNPAIGEQGRHTENFYLLICFSILWLLDFFMVVQLAVCDLMDSGGNRLYLAHALTNGDTLLAGRKISVCISRHLLKRNRNRGGAFQRLHKRLKVLHIPKQIRRQGG